MATFTDSQLFGFKKLRAHDAPCPFCEQFNLKTTPKCPACNDTGVLKYTYAPDGYGDCCLGPRKNVPVTKIWLHGQASRWRHLSLQHLLDEHTRVCGCPGWPQGNG